jgi:hypothetical protein
MESIDLGSNIDKLIEENEDIMYKTIPIDLNLNNDLFREKINLILGEDELCFEIGATTKSVDTEKQLENLKKINSQILSINYKDIIKVERIENQIQINFIKEIKQKKCCSSQIKKTRKNEKFSFCPNSKTEKETQSLLKEIYSKSFGINLSLQSILKTKFLLFINPFGGKGKARSIFNQIELIFSSSFVNVEVFETQFYKHAYEHSIKMDLTEYHGIICCSGDGIIHEVINGLLHRTIKEEIPPIGIIPCGSGNGLAKTICDERTS